MRSFVVLLCLVPYCLVQAASEPATPTVQQKAATALHECTQEKKLDENKTAETFKSDTLPEDKPEFTDFFTCFWKKLDIIKADDTLHHESVKSSLPPVLKDRYPDIKDAEKIASDAVDHCKDTPKGDSVGITAIKFRNCVTLQIKESVKKSAA